MSLQSLGRDRTGNKNKNVVNNPNVMPSDGATGSMPMSTPLTFSAGPQNEAAMRRRVPKAPRDGSFFGLR